MHDAGREPPAQFYERPDVWPWLDWVWDGFWDLDSERQIGMGPGRIPSSKIRDYASTVVELPNKSEAADRFFFLIRRMDSEYLSDNQSANAAGNREIPVDDIRGVSALFRKIETRKKSEKQKKERKR